MELRFIGADHEVTGSCHYLQVGGKHILIDVGMEQGRDVFENQPLPVPASSIDFVFLTHAHIDHSGMLPKICHDGFRGGVICTGATRALCEIMLRDSAHIQAQETEWRSKKVKKSAEEKEYEPIYTMEDVMTVMKQFSTYPYGKIFTLCEGVKFRFTDIGHLLGSCSIELWLTEGGVTRKIVFSGDIGNNDQPLLRDPALTEEAEYVVMESTYGDRYHEKEKIDPVEELANMAICLCHQVDAALEKFIDRLDKEFATEGGIRERMTAARLGQRETQKQTITRQQQEITALKQQIAALEQQIAHLKNQ